MDMHRTTANINGRNIRVDFFGSVAYNENGLVDDAKFEEQKKWALIHLETDIMEGRIVEYHEDDDDIDSMPRMVICNGPRMWRIDFIDAPDVENNGNVDITVWDDTDDCGEVADTIPDMDARDEWIQLAFHIRQVQ